MNAADNFQIAVNVENKVFCSEVSKEGTEGDKALEGINYDWLQVQVHLTVPAAILSPLFSIHFLCQ